MSPISSQRWVRVPSTQRKHSPRTIMRVVALVLVLAAALLFGASIATPRAEAHVWHTKLAASGHHGGTFGPVTLYGGRETRFRYWTARVLEDDGEWDYDWVKFRLVRRDTGTIIRTFGPIYRPTGYLDWTTVAVRLPARGHPYVVRVTCDDARWGFRLQQKY